VQLQILFLSPKKNGDSPPAETGLLCHQQKKSGDNLVALELPGCHQKGKAAQVCGSPVKR